MWGLINYGRVVHNLCGGPRPLNITLAAILLCRGLWRLLVLLKLVGGCIASKLNVIVNS